MKKKFCIFLVLCFSIIAENTYSQCSFTANLSSAKTTICSGSSVLLQADASQAGTYTYEWNKDGVSISNATDQSYQVNAAGTYYAIITDQSLCSQQTNSIAITVDPAVIAGTISTAQTICPNTSPLALLGTQSTGGSGTRYYKWQSTTTSPAGPWTSVMAYGSSTSYAPGALNSTTYFRRVDSAGACQGVFTNVITITVQPILNPGVISAFQTVCYNSPPATLTNITAPTGGAGPGTYLYSWEQSTNGGSSWTTISNATNANYSPNPLTTTTQFRRKVTSGTGTCNVAVTTAITVTVNPDIIPGSIGSGQTICENTTPAGITSMTSATGGTGTYTYQWESSPIPVGTWVAIPSATNATHSPGVLTASTSYRRKVTSGFCGTVASNQVDITVTPNVTPSVTIAPGPDTFGCSGDVIAFAATVPNGITPTSYQWYKNGAAVATSTNATYTSSSFADNDVVHVEMTATLSCATPGSNPATSSSSTVHITGAVAPMVSISVIPGTTICAGMNVTFTANPLQGAGISPTYQWTLNGSNVGTGGTTYTSSTLNHVDIVGVVMTSSSACASPITAAASKTMIVNPILVPSVTISSDKSTICAGATVIFTATPANEGATPSYQWRLNGTALSGATSATYLTTTLANNDQIDVVLTSTAFCANPTTANSTAISTTVNPILPVSVSLSQSGIICQGASAIFTASSVNGGTSPTYEWNVNGTSLQSGTSNSYTSSVIKDGDVVGVVLTSNGICTVGNPARAQTVANVFSTNCADISKISGRVYKDLNSDGSIDSGEDGLAGVKVMLDSSNIVFTDASGLYEFYVEKGAIHDVAVISPNESYVRTLPSMSYKVSVTSGGVTFSDNNFGLYQETVKDLFVILSANAARPGFGTTLYVQYSNIGNSSVDGKIKLTYPEGLVFNSSSVNNANHNAQQHTIEIPYSNLSQGTTYVWSVNFNVPSTLALGTVLTSTVEGTINSNDDDHSENNVDIESVVVRGSFDPNDKAVLPAGIQAAGLVEKNVPLTYTIRFQNTGTDKAFTVIVRDTIDEDLDITSLEMLGASHDYIVSAKGRVLSWAFYNINLPDKTTNEPKSHGFIKYRLKQKKDLALGSEIKNKAAIYFDFNEPVITNETLNTIGENLVSSVIPKSSYKSIVVYPNPATSEIRFSGIENTFDYEITDLAGNQIMRGSSDERLNISSMERGIYFIKITTENGVYVDKIVKE